MKVGILGATGYTGHELVRILANHEEADVVYLSAGSTVGQDYESIYPHTLPLKPGKLQDQRDIPALDVLFCALPHGITSGLAEEVLVRGIKVIDLGADFRLQSVAEYEHWYKVKHQAPQLLSQAVYGLPELYREEIRGSSLVANPGCYPTASLLALVPLLEAKLIEPSHLIIDAKSGVSGAGRGVGPANHFAEINENFKPYGMEGHRHTPEIEQQLEKAAGGPVRINFTPHLVPMNRGMLATIYADPAPGVTAGDLRRCWQRHYGNEEFVHLLPEGVWPQTKFAAGSNHAFLQLMVDERTGRAVIVSAIDNLLKGASGQAIQNMNLIMGLPEGTGLKGTALWP